MNDHPTHHPSFSVEDQVIAHAPLRLRFGPWHSPRILQVAVEAAAAWEAYRAECLATGRDPAGQMPPHFSLEGNLAEVARALLRHHHDPGALEEVHYLGALLEALLASPCAILRTDLIRRVYQEVERFSTRLGLRFHAQGGGFLLPLAEDAGHPHALQARVAAIDNLATLFATLREVAHARYRSLARGYVIYYPRFLPRLPSPV